MQWWDKFRKDVEADLDDWQEETGQPLPEGWTAEEIAAAEANGGVVDLETGELLADGEADATYLPLYEFDDDGGMMRIVR